MLLALLVWSAEAGSVDVGEALIGYGVAAPLVAWLIWQLRSDRAAYVADVTAHREQLDLEREANRKLYDRIIEQQAAVAPILERAARALEQTAGSGR